MSKRKKTEVIVQYGSPDVIATNQRGDALRALAKKYQGKVRELVDVATVDGELISMAEQLEGGAQALRSEYERQKLLRRKAGG